MADVFISYAQGDRAWVKGLAAALEAEGLSVWWDPQLLPGAKYRDAINAELSTAKAIIVVWSRLSLASDYVRDEAEDGRKAGKLVPVLCEPVEPPHGFRQIQTADLSQWQRRREDSQFRHLIDGIAALAGHSGTANAAAAHHVELPPTPSSRDGLSTLMRKPAIVAAGAAVAVALLAAVLWHFAAATPAVESQAVPLPSFACARAMLPDEKIICRSVELAALELRVYDAYTAAGGPRNSPADIHAFMIKQLARRHECASANCVRTVLQGELDFFAQRRH